MASDVDVASAFQVASDLEIRAVRDSDAPGLADLLNEIIALGGTTALEQPFTPEGLATAMLTGPDILCCFVAQDRAGEPAGFQSLTRSAHLPEGIGDIGTFSRVGSVQKGTGSSLFAATKRAAGEMGLTAINATIRADNAGGLAFYTRLGFADHDIRLGVPLRNGVAVDRIVKRYDLGTGR